MSSQDTTSQKLTLYAADFRWNGETQIPYHRRLTDFVNDSNLAAIVLNDVSTAVWFNDTLRETHTTEMIAVPKRNTILVVPRSDITPPGVSSHERVHKVPFHILIHLPSYTVIGDLNLLPNTNWLNILTVAHQEFSPITNASVWRTKTTTTQLETNLRLLLVNRQEIIALEPQK